MLKKNVTIFSTHEAFRESRDLEIGAFAVLISHFSKVVRRWANQANSAASAYKADNSNNGVPSNENKDFLF